MTAYNVVSPASLSAGQPEDVSVILANLNAIASIINGQLDNGNLSAGAAIAIAKLAGYPADATKALLGDGSWGGVGTLLATALPGVPTDGQQIAYTDSLTAPTFVWLLRYNATATKWYPFGEGWGYGTALPAVPALVDGVTFVLVDSVTNPQYQWRFRFNSVQAALGYKWEFVGGVSPIIVVGANESRAANTYGALATPGPSFTLPRAGVYNVDIGYLRSTGTANFTYMSFDIGATPASDNNAATGQGDNRQGSRYISQITVAAANTALVAKYKCDNTTSTNWYNRWMQVTPMRVI